VIEVGKYYSAYPEFTRLEGARSFDRKTQKSKAQKMTGLCIFASPRLVTLAFANGIQESFRPDEVK
jgi:hypothetical protein